MKKRVKVFETGKYPQGEYDFQRVRKIFGDINSIPIQINALIFGGNKNKLSIFFISLIKIGDEKN